MIQHMHVITLNSDELPSMYMLYPLLQCWQDQGIRITTGPVTRLDADIGLLHINNTWIAPEVLPSNPKQHPIINGSVLDISKRRISRHILAENSNYNGPVIIKTNANYFGKREFQKLPARSLKLLRQKLGKYLPWQYMHELPPNSYPVLESISQVPEWIWRRDDLVVECFQPEIENGEYVLRMWMFLGDRHYGAKLYSNEPIVKVDNINRYEYLESVPDKLQRIRRELRMDYGKLDYVMINGEPVLLDANTTPTISTRKPSARLLGLAAGLSAFDRAA